MRRTTFLTLAILTLGLVPSLALACAMEFEIPDEIDEEPGEPAALVSLMESIDLAIDGEAQTNETKAAEQAPSTELAVEQETPAEASKPEAARSASEDDGEAAAPAPVTKKSRDG